MDFSFVKYNPSNFRIPPRNTCLLSNVYDVPCISPSVDKVKQCSKKIESFQNNESNIVLQNKKYLWTFVEDNTPNYIKLNIESYNKFYKNNFTIVVINKNNVYNYLPQFPFNLEYKNKISMKKVVDYLKYSLLYNYGGLWIDSSVLIYKYFNFNKLLLSNDFVLFNNPNFQSCNDTFQLPHTKILLAKPKLDIFKYLLDTFCNSYDFEFGNVSEKVLYNAIKLYNSSNKCNNRYSNTKILVLPSYNIGKLSSHNKILQVNDYLKKYKYLIKPEAFCTIIDNNENYYKSPNELFYYNLWFLKLENELLNSGMFVSYLYRLNN